MQTGRDNNFSDEDSNNFPKIGLNRTFCRNIKVNPFDETEMQFNTYEKVDVSGMSSGNSLFEDVLTKNMQNLNKYKNEGCTVIFDESQSVKRNYTLNFQELLNVLALDESAFENFIEKEKGAWVDHLDHMENEINTNSDQNTSSNTCEFESRFESGNLRMAIRISDTEYDLILKNDINSGKSYQWFFFEVKVFLQKLIDESNSSNISTPRKRIKFNIINCQKNDMLYSKGLRVLKYSEDTKKWSRDTKDIYYFVNGLSVDDKKFYTLTFSIDVDLDLNKNKDCDSTSMVNNPLLSQCSTFYFSYCYPYTFSDLENYLKKIFNDKNIERILRRETIGTSLSGNKLEMLIITNFESDFDAIACRPAVFLTARVHPGESNSSFAIQGVIDFLIEKDNPVSKSLRNLYIFKIVPMLNPDGVINGNFRNDLLGKDLNRMWMDPRENTCPTIFYTKEIIKKTLQSRDIFLFCDFHGHSNKNNFFLYSCPIKKNKPNNYQEMILPKIYQKKNDYFDPSSCIYKIAQSKLKTARAVVRNEFGVDLSYCLESSIGSITLGENTFSFFTPQTYTKIGSDFCLSLLDMSDKSLFNEMLCSIQMEEALKLVNLENNENNTNERKKVNGGTGTGNKKKLKPIKVNKDEGGVGGGNTLCILGPSGFGAITSQRNSNTVNLISPKTKLKKELKKITNNFQGGNSNSYSNSISLNINSHRMLSDSNLDTTHKNSNGTGLNFIKFNSQNNHTLPKAKVKSLTSISTKKIIKIVDSISLDVKKK